VVVLLVIIDQLLGWFWDLVPQKAQEWAENGSYEYSWQREFQYWQVEIV